MKIPIKWLAEYVDISGVTDEKLSEILTMSGTENEIVKDGGSFPGIVVGEIIKIEKHPNADKLQVTVTKVGSKKSDELQIVCGAPNIEVGQKVPVALSGAQIGEFEIKETEIRGVKSQGMLCSESELGISDDHSGIMILDPRAKVGVNLDDALNIGGTVLEAEITPNRGDCLSLIGVARETAAALDRKLKNLKFSNAQIKSSKIITVEVKDKDLCPRYIAKVVEGVKIGPSPKWMQDRLSAAGIRPISNVVDVTNYVMLEWGQPLHAFDFSKISGSVNTKDIKQNTKKIIVRKAKAGEKIETLDGVSRVMTKNDLLICDSEKPVAIAGVMGGANSEVDVQTNTIVFEAAVFDRTSVRKTAQRLGLRSEASNRFEKGIPIELPEIAIERAAQLIEEISKEKKEKSNIKTGPNNDVLSDGVYPKYVGMRISRFEKVLGIKIPVERQIKILESLGFEAEKFDFKKEARKHVGKPYVFGAKYSTHGDMAFDCSYLTDYIYRKLSKFIGHTALGQYELGEPVKGDLKIGDLLFYKSLVKKEWTDHYYFLEKDGSKKRVGVKPPKEVGHVGIYIGNDRVIHAHQLEYDYKNKKWVKSPTSRMKVEEDSVEIFTKNPEYLGARRFVEDPFDWLSIKVPWWRLDVSREEDIFEEIGRIYGYDKFPTTLPSGELPKFEDTGKLKMISEIKNVLIGAGFTEALNYSFVSGKVLDNSGEAKEKALKISNPISPEQEYMRTNLIDSLLTNAAKNQDNFDTISIFEIASIYLPVKGEDLPREIPTLAILIKTQKVHKESAFYRTKGVFELVANKLNLREIEYKEEKEEPKSVFEKGRISSISHKGTRIGVLGEISEITKNSFGLKYDFAVLQVNLSSMVSDYGQVKKYHLIPKYPTSARDISLIFNGKTSAVNILKELDGLKSPIVLGYEILDIYEGKGLPENKKSITIRLVIGSEKGTLSEEEISGAQSLVVELLRKKLGGTVRF